MEKINRVYQSCQGGTTRVSIITGLIVLIFALVASSLPVSAEQWINYGPRAEAMGGAGVAIADGATAQYWNPAATSKNTRYGLYIPFSLDTSAEGDLIASVDRLATASEKIDWSSAFSSVNNGAPLTVTQAQQLLDFFSYASTELNKSGQGVLLNNATGPVFTLGHLSIFGNNFLYMNIDPVADKLNLSVNSSANSAITNTVGAGPFNTPVNTALANQIASQPWWIAASGGNPTGQANQFVWLAEQGGANTADPAIQEALTLIAEATAGGGTGVSVANNKSGVIINGLMVTEIGASYSRPIMGESLFLGGNLKMMEGRTYYHYVNFQNLQNGTETLNDITNLKNIKTSSTFGIDLGVLYSLNDRVNVGVTARNVNTPKFAYAGPGIQDVKLDPQVRAGVSVDVVGKKFLMLAADYDLTKNKSVLLPGYESQTFGVGAEINLIGILKIRGGMSKNLGSKYDDRAYTAGVGLHLIWLDIDLAGMLAPSKVNISSQLGGGTIQTVPQETGVSLAVALRF